MSRSNFLTFLLALASSLRRTTAWTTTPPPPPSSPFFRPVPADAAQELEDYFSSGKAVVDLQDFENVVNSNGVFPQTVLGSDGTTTKPSYETLESRVRNLEVQLAQLLKFGIPTESLAEETTSIPPVPPSTALSLNKAQSTASIKTFQGIPYYCRDTASKTVANIPTPDSTIQKNENAWEFRLKQELENGMHMRGGGFCKAMEVTTPVSTPTIVQTSNDEQESGAMSSVVVLDPRQMQLQNEIDECRLLSRQALKKELEDRGIDTKALFEKSEFVTRLAEARILEAEAQEQSTLVVVKEIEVTKEVEVVTDDEEPWNRHRSYASEGVPTGGIGGFVQNGVVVNAGNGDKIGRAHV